MKAVFLFIAFLFLQHSYAQKDSITLERCYELAKQNYPLTKQKELLDKGNELSNKNIDLNYFPKLRPNAQATYQSEVPSIPIKIPNLNIPELNKDQYKAVIDINQIIYDGGLTAKQKDLQNSSLQINQQNIEVELSRLKDRVNQIYFNILLMQENRALSSLLEKDLTLRLNKIEAGVKSGIQLASNVDAIKAELLNIDEKIIEIKSNEKTYYLMLAELIQQPISDNTILIKPIVKITEAMDLGKRDEVKLFMLQQKNFDNAIQLIGTKRKPKLSGFLQTGFGRPGINLFDNTFQPFYYTGIRFNWNIWDWNSDINEIQLANINRQIIQKQQEVFELNTRIWLKQQAGEIEKYQALIAEDKEIIDLRRKISQTSQYQLENGTLNANDYLLDINAQNKASQNLISHEIQLLLAKITYATTQGN